MCYCACLYVYYSVSMKTNSIHDIFSNNCNYNLVGKFVEFIF